MTETEVARIERDAQAGLAELGLQLAEAKQLTAALQAEMVSAQVAAVGERRRGCGACGTAWNLDERLGGPVSCGETDGVFPCRLRIRHGARPCPPAAATPTPLRPTSARSVPARTCLATACACS